MNAAEIFAKNADERRRALGLSQEELASRLGKPRPMVTKYLQGKTVLGIDLLLEWAKALETTPQALLGTDPFEEAESFRKKAISALLDATPSQLAILEHSFKGVFPDVFSALDQRKHSG